MPDRRPWIVATVLSFAACCTASSTAADGLPDATQRLFAHYPGVRAQLAEGHVVALYGAPMTERPTAVEAVDGWFAEHGDAFGILNLELQFERAVGVGRGRSTVYAYTQYVGALPVENTLARVLVLNGSPAQVVYAAGVLAAMPEGGFQVDAITGDEAVAHVSRMLPYKRLTEWTQPVLVIYAGAGLAEFGNGPGRFGPAVRAWKFTGTRPILNDFARQTFFVDAATKRLVAARNEVHNVDISGSVQGMATPWGPNATIPDLPSNPPALHDVPEIRVSITGGSNAFADRAGDYTIPHGGATPVTVSVTLDDGQWVEVNTDVGTVLSLSQSVTPPGPGDFTFNPSPAGANTAQVNAFIHTILIHSFFKDRVPEWTGLDIQITANTNIASTCNAFYSGQTINFFSTGGGCPNTAYSSVVAHEYGHFVVNQLGLSQGAFGEGFGDSCSILLYDDPVIGRNFFNMTTPVRQPDVTSLDYPCPASCGGAVHCCGEMLGGLWYDLRETFGAAYGSQPGLDLVRDLFADWSQVTVGGIGNNPAHPATAVEILTLDDNDGRLDNGTPNYFIICDAFGQHTIPCPPFTPFDFVFPDGLPGVLTPEQTSNVRVNLVPVGATPVPNSGTVSYRIGAGTFTTVPMTETAPNEYLGTLPVVACGSSIDFYFSAGFTTGTAQGTLSSPRNAPQSSYNAFATYSSALALDDSFETDQGWVVGDPLDTAPRGLWVRVDPIGTVAQPEDDHSPSPGATCWATGQGVVGGGAGAADVDAGRTTLTSPPFSLIGAADGRVEYWRWFSNNSSPIANEDRFRVQIDNGASGWVDAEVVGPTGPECSGGWFAHSFFVSEIVPPTGSVRLRFIASDFFADSTIEAALDDVRVVAVDCTPGDCAGDLNGDNQVGLPDLTVLLANFGSSNADPSQGDLDDDNDVDLSDLTAFLALFGTVCP